MITLNKHFASETFLVENNGKMHFCQAEHSLHSLSSNHCSTTYGLQWHFHQYKMPAMNP